MSSFDPATFLDAQLTEPSEKRKPLPIGDYTAVVGEVTSRAWTGKSDPTKSGIAFDVPVTLEVPAELQVELQLPPTITLKDSIMIDITASGTIDMTPGKNRRLRIWREALNLNKVGDSFSPRAMQGKIVKVKLSHEIYEGQPVERIDSVVRS